MPTWNKNQRIALAMIPKVSSSLSLFGSIWICIEVWTGTHEANRTLVPNRQHPYHRLLLGMSVYEILESVWNFSSTWPIPAGTTTVYGARGTQFTCTVQGFFLTLGLAIPIYNAMLALYYVLVVKCRVTDTMMRRRIEPIMHVVAGGWALGGAVAAAVLNLYNNANLWCWIAPYPANCLDSWRFPEQANCIRGDNAWIYRWAFYFAPLWFCILFAGKK